MNWRTLTTPLPKRPLQVAATLYLPLDWTSQLVIANVIQFEALTGRLANARRPFNILLLRSPNLLVNGAKESFFIMPDKPLLARCQSHLQANMSSYSSVLNTNESRP